MRIIETSEAPRAIGPYSQAVATQSMVYCSGQLGLDPETGQLAGADVASQTNQAMKNLQAVLKEAGLSLDHVVRTTIYLADLDDFATVNAIYADALGDHKPARATVQVARLPMDGLVEIDAIAKGC